MKQALLACAVLSVVVQAEAQLVTEMTPERIREAITSGRDREGFLLPAPLPWGVRYALFPGGRSSVIRQEDVPAIHRG